MKNTIRIPRYLGLSSVPQTAQGQTSFEFGYTNHLRRELTVDEDGASLIGACMKPTTVDEIQKQTKLPLLKIRKGLRALQAAGVVKQELKAPTKLQRYDRHLLFYDLQGADAVEAQKKVSRARIALIGMGGIGSWVSLGLIGAGFKELKLIDFDRVELTNLTRQILFTEADIGKSKTGIAAERLRERNTQTQVTPVDTRVTNVKSLRKLLRGMDFVVISADRPAQIHDWVDEVCVELDIPYLNLGYRDGSGVIGPMTVAGETSCYQCHKPELTKRSPASEESWMERFENRYQAPSFGPLNALVSSLGVMEIIKKISGIGAIRSHGTELEVDPMTLQIHETPYKRDLGCWHCGAK